LVKQIVAAAGAALATQTINIPAVRFSLCDRKNAALLFIFRLRARFSPLNTRQAGARARERCYKIQTHENSLF
jgi:hypothetical protein